MTTCWGITTGQAGMVAQVKALAAALKLTPEMKTIAIRAPFAWLPNAVYASPLRSVIPCLITGDALEAPYPDVIITCGRRAALVAIGFKSKAPNTRFIHVQDPQVSAKYFDLVVAMQHDKITGDNVLKTRFALHAITPEVLQQARQKFEPVFAQYPQPRMAVLLGGSTNKYTLTSQAMGHVIGALQTLQTHMSLLITPSRRTGEANIHALQQAFAGNERVYIYDSRTENPYLGLLALADAILVTNDSVNMMSEACATGKPVYILPLPGHQNTKPARFAQQLANDGIARIAGDSLEQWNYTLSDEMGKLALNVRARLKLDSTKAASAGFRGGC